MDETVQKIEQAAQRGAQIVCLQELFRTQYFPQERSQNVQELAETIPGESTRILSELAKKHGITIIAPLFEKSPNGKFYNSAVVIGSNGDVLGTYRKTHIPDDPYFYEKDYFAEAEPNYQVFDTGVARIAVLICYDQWYPEAARINTLKGSEIIFYPTAIGYINGHTSQDGDWHEAWKTIQRAHAIANGVHVAAVNRVGEEGLLQFWGGSFICDSFGEVVAEASTQDEEVLVATLDLSKNKKIQDGWGFLKNRRPDTYCSIVNDIQANLVQQCRKSDYRMPAEWEKHEAIWLAWPYDPLTFPNRVERVEKTFAQIIKEIHSGEHVNLLVKDEAAKQKVTVLLEQAGVDLDRVSFHVFSYADVWFRDYGPIFVKNGAHELAMIHWDFNSWGEKYDELLKDKQIPNYINQKMKLCCFKPGIVLEGGSIDVNGKGTLLTTEQCLLNSNRNPCLTKPQIQRYLSDYLGVTHFIWLKSGILGDDTDGHIDDLARFVNPTTVVCAYQEDPNDVDYAALEENYRILCESVDQIGNKLNIVKLPMPKVVSDEGERLPASYTNFYIGNEKVLVPIFDHPNDELALSILQGLFLTRKVVGIKCVDLVYGFGTIHCISQQQPCP